MQEKINYVPEEVIGEVNRDEQSERILRLFEKLNTSEISGNEESKRELLKHLDFEGFKRLLLTLNGNLMAIPPAKRELFAGEMELVKAEGAEGQADKFMAAFGAGGEDNFTPLQEDKDGLLHSLFDHIKKMVGEEAKIEDVALLTGVGINAIHAFKDGNGRTSRLLYYLMSENYQGTQEQKEHLQKLLGEKGRLMVDLAPSHANDEIVDYIQENKLGISKDVRVRILGINKLSLPKNISKDVRQDFKKYIFAASAFDNAKGLGALAALSVIKARGNLLQYCRYGEYDTTLSSEKLNKHLRQEDLEQILKLYWQLKKESVEILFDALTTTWEEGQEASGLSAIKKSFLEKRDVSERESLQEVNEQKLEPIWSRLSPEHYTQQEIPAVELATMRDIRTKAIQLTEQDTKERAALNFDFAKAEKDLEEFRMRERVDIERDPEGYNVFANKLFDKERELYAPLIEVSEKNLRAFMEFLDQQPLWKNKFATRRPYEHTTEDRQVMTDSLYYITPSGCSLRLLTYSLPKEGLKMGIQPFMEKVIYIDENGNSHDAPQVGLNPVEYVTDNFWDTLKAEDEEGFMSRVKRYEIDGQNYYINPTDGDVHRAYPVVRVTK